MQPDRLLGQASFVAVCRFVENAEISRGSDQVRSDLMYSDLTCRPEIGGLETPLEVLSPPLRAPKLSSQAGSRVGLFVTGSPAGT